MILLQGHAVTLTFNVASQMSQQTRHLNMVIIFVKYFYNPTSNNEVMGQTRIQDVWTDGWTTRQLYKLIKL